MYRLDILVQGFPGKAVCHGGLGWSTIALLRSAKRKILIDVGAFGIRKPLAKQLAAHGLAPADITDVVLTHAHYDHCVNFVLFDPGHDLTMRLDTSGRPTYVGQRRAGISAWFAETLDDTTDFDMSGTTLRDAAEQWVIGRAAGRSS